jgi:hypothetical protein
MVLIACSHGVICNSKWQPKMLSPKTSGVQTSWFLKLFWLLELFCVCQTAQKDGFSFFREWYETPLSLSPGAIPNPLYDYVCPTFLWTLDD